MLSALLVVPPLLLIATLVVSAVAKLLDPRDTSSVFVQLRLPRALLRLRVPRLLPYGELVLAALLLVAPGASYVVATTATLLLFLAYFLVILRALRLPYPVSCACFGRLGLGEVTPQTLARNTVLLALAVVAWVASWADAEGGAVQQWAALDGWVAWVSGLAIAALGVAFVVALALVVRRRGRSTVGAEDPDAYLATPAPKGTLDGPDGPVPLHALTDQAARLLVFCDPTRDTELVARIPAWSESLAPVRVHLVVDGPAARGALGDPDGVLGRRLGITTPGAVLLGTDRMLAGGPVTGSAEVADLVEAVAVELGVAPPA